MLAALFFTNSCRTAATHQINTDTWTKTT